jgi:pimeloyl-ACP methyl ester carboxylesterase
VVVVGSPIHGSSLALPLKFAGFRSIAWALFTFFPLFRAGVRLASPLICGDPRFPEMMDSDLSKTTLESFLVSISTLRKTDLRPNLAQIHVPVMGMYGDRDNIVHPRQWKPLKAGVSQARIERYPRAGHFIMLDEPKNFQLTLKDFLDKAETN